MARSPGCPPAETLAAFMDAGPSWRERRALVAHLDGCSRCRTVLAYAGQFEASLTAGPTEQPDSPAWWRQPRFALAGGVTFAFLLIFFTTQSSFVPVIVSWLSGGPSIDEFSTEALLSPLFLKETVAFYSDHRWTGQTNSFLFGAGRTRTQTSFRIGVQLVDFRVSLEESRPIEASAALQNLRSLSRIAGGRELFSDRWSWLEEALSEGRGKDRFDEELDQLDDELYAELDPLAFDLGRWTEAGRLAAASHDARYFAEPSFQSVLAQCSEQKLSQPVDQALEGIRTLASPIPSEKDLAELERSFRQLILLY